MSAAPPGPAEAVSLILARAWCPACHVTRVLVRDARIADDDIRCPLCDGPVLLDACGDD